MGLNKSIGRSDPRRKSERDLLGGTERERPA